MRAAHKAFPLVLALAALALPCVADAAEPCPVIGALLAENPKQLRGIGVTINRAGTIDVTLNGAADSVRGAESCSLYGPAKELSIDCHWSFEAGEDTEARRAFEAMKGRLEACLPTPLERKEPLIYSEQQLAEAAQQQSQSFADYLRNREVIADYEQSYPLDREEEHSLQVSVTLIRDRKAGSLRMDIDLERD